MLLPFRVSVASVCLLAQAAAQQVPAERAIPSLALEAQQAAQADETVVIATRRTQPAFEVPGTTAVVHAEQLAERSYRTLPQALRDVPGVMVQETSPGQGSPYLRGFTGFRNLFLIDGIRLNNSVFRDGPNEYWNTVDTYSLERLELVKGPASVLYGSDAIGGTVNALTRSVDWTAERPVSAALDYRYAAAERAHVGRAQVQTLLGARSGLLLGLTLKDLGDFEGGRELGTLENTGYRETDAELSFEHWLNGETRLSVAHQRVSQDDVPRTHSTLHSKSWEGTSVGTDRRRDLDHERALTYARVEGRAQASAFDEYSLTLSWHAQDETQVRVRSSGARTVSAFEVDTLGLLGQFSKATPLGELTYGLDAYRDLVDSESNTNPVQGPVADDSTYDTLGLFAQDRFSVSERLELTLGARFNHAAVDAGRVADPVSGSPFEIEEQWDALVTSARFLYRLTPATWNLFGGVSQGFRSPNLSDLTRFDEARTNEFEVPSPGLDPEEYLSFELGLRAQLESVSAEAAFFYTDISDLIVRFPTGNTNALGEFEITKDNVGDGWVYGIELGAAWEFRADWTLFGDATFIEGRAETYPSSAQQKDSEWLDRLMPLTARLGLRWEHGAGWAEGLLLAAGEADKLSTRDQADTQRIPPGGTPGHAVLHLSAGRRINEHLRVRVGLENVFDEDYRVHGSGTNMPGRNLIVGASFSF